MKKFLLTALLILFGSTCFATESPFRRAETFSDIHAASCRVRVSSSIGSGTFIGFTDDACWILTNYHVVGKENNVKIDFWTNSKLETVDGKVSWRFYDVNLPGDFAFVKIDARDLKRIDPPFVPPAGPDVKPTEHGFIASSGCPDGRFAQAWRGEVISYYNGKTAVFQPPPVPGQSGSGIIEYIDGKPYVVGVLTWLFGQKGLDESTGGAIPISNLYLAADGRVRLEIGTGGNIEAIPPDAVECSDTIPVLRGEREVNALMFVVFKQPNCVHCVTYENELKDTEKLGAKVARISKNIPDESAMFQSWGVTGTPATFIAARTSQGGYIKHKRLNDGVIPSRTLNSEFDSIRKKIYLNAPPLEEDIPLINASLNNDDVKKTRVPNNEDFMTENNGLEIVDIGESQPNVEENVDKQEASESEENKPALVDFSAPPELDFRDREPVHQSGMGLGILDKSKRDWENRSSEPTEEAPVIDKEKELEPKNERLKRNSDSTGLTQRLVDAIVDGALKSIDEKLSAKQDEIQAQFELFKDKVFRSIFLLVIIAFITANVIVRVFIAIVRWVSARFKPAVVAFCHAMDEAWKDQPNSTTINKTTKTKK